MTMLTKYLALILVLGSLAAPMAFAQIAGSPASPQSITQSPSRLDSCTVEATATAASSAVATATVTPPAGQYFYVCSIYIVETINAAVTGAAGPQPIMTSTNLQNNLVWWGDNSQTFGAGALIPIANSRFGVPLKSQTAGTAFTIASNGGGQSTSNVRIQFTGYFAP